MLPTPDDRGPHSNLPTVIDVKIDADFEQEQHHKPVDLWVTYFGNRV